MNSLLCHLRTVNNQPCNNIHSWICYNLEGRIDGNGNPSQATLAFLLPTRGFSKTKNKETCCGDEVVMKGKTCPCHWVSISNFNPPAPHRPPPQPTCHQASASITGTRTGFSPVPLIPLSKTSLGPFILARRDGLLSSHSTSPMSPFLLVVSKYFQGESSIL